MGLSRPRRKILGQEFAGEVEAVGENVRSFKTGDRVFGSTGLGFGAYAEYVCLPENSRGRAMATMPGNLTFQEAAAVPTGGLEALHFLRRAGDLRGRQVLIRGAGGGIGMYAVQVAKDSGAEVTGIDRTERVDLLRALGADRAVDYTRGDFALGERTFDVIFDVAGKGSFTDDVQALKEGGRYLLANPSLSARVRGVWTSIQGGKKVVSGAATHRSEDLVYLGGLLAARRVRSIIDREFPLEQTPQAHRYFESGLARGKVVITP